MTDCEFWCLVTILPSVDNEEAQTRSFCLFTTCCMPNFFSFVNTGFGSVPSAFPGGFISPYCHIVRRHLAMQHLEELHSQSLNTWCLEDLLTPAAFCKVLQLREGFVAAFPSCFVGVEGSGHYTISSAPWSVKGVYVLYSYYKWSFILMIMIRVEKILFSRFFVRTY